MAQTPQDIEDVLILEDVDLSDESKLRQAVAEIEALVKAPGKGLRISVLSAEQWETIKRHVLPARQRRAAAHYIHQLRDPSDPQHLLISPSGVSGINEGVRPIWQEIVYAVLRCLPTELDGQLRKGVDDIVAEVCAEQIGVEIFARVNPKAAALVRSLVGVCAAEHGYRERDWVLLLRRDPARFFLALRKTKFSARWVSEAREDRQIGGLVGNADDPKAQLIAMISSPDLSPSDHFARMTQSLADQYLQDLKKKEKGQ